MCTILVLALVAAGSLFAAWHWVDSQIDRSSWLTDAADTHGTSWLILGSDERDTEGGAGGSSSETPGSRTDTILVLTRAQNGKGSLISIPRDSLVQTNGQYMKVNAVAQAFGQSTFVGTIEGITGEKIDHVTEIRFDGLTDVVNALGGVRLCYDSDVNDANSGMVWTKGCHNADGTTALAFSRMRYSDPLGDFGRTLRQRQLMSAIIAKSTARSTLTNPSRLSNVARTALKSMVFDEDASPYTLLMMALTMRDATGSSGITGSVYWKDPDYYVRNVGSTVQLDESKNTALFSALMEGTHAPGTVGTLADSQ